MAKSVMVTGATGLLGRQVVTAFQRAGWDVVGTGFSRAKPPSILKVDLADREQVEKVLTDNKVQVVVHCAANRFPDKCDADPDGARALNIEASRALAEATQTRSILLVYISTDYVFPGNQGDAPYETDAPTAPPNLYGQTKLDGERAILSVTEPTGLGVVLRVPVLYGPAETPSESAVNVLLDTVWKAQEKNAKIKVDDWAIRYPTNTEDIGRVLVDVADRYSGAKDLAELPKILQFSSEDRYTKYEMCKLLSEIMALPIDGLVGNREGNDPTAAVQRPFDCHLSTKRLKDLQITLHTQNFEDWWKREVKAYKR
ncbi:MAG: hypothetical protein M1833_001543 [Piccolia ochrophora]|nr:MAG: hypothetical protein M1833_001543 [Piccolia ochrophora]